MGKGIIPNPLPVPQRRYPLLLPENPAKVQGVFISHNTSDLSDAVGRVFQEHLCVGDADGEDVLQRRGIGIGFKIADKPAYAHTAGSGVVFDLDIQVVMVIKILGSQIHFVV